MKKIGGNEYVEIQVRTTTENEIGEQIENWETVDTLKGFLDLTTGDSKYTTYSAKIQESSHVFITDYKTLDRRIKANCSRILRLKTGELYEITLIDNPMELNPHIEFYLKYTGGQNAQN